MMEPMSEIVQGKSRDTVVACSTLVSVSTATSHAVIGPPTF